MYLLLTIWSTISTRLQPVLIYLYHPTVEAQSKPWVSQRWFSIVSPFTCARLINMLMSWRLLSPAEHTNTHFTVRKLLSVCQLSGINTNTHHRLRVQREGHDGIYVNQVTVSAVRRTGTETERNDFRLWTNWIRISLSSENYFQLCLGIVY